MESITEKAKALLLSIAEKAAEEIKRTIKILIAIPKAVFGGIFKIFGMMLKMAEIILNPFNKYNR